MMVKKHLLSFWWFSFCGNFSSWSVSASCGCWSIRAGWTDWPPLNSQSDCGLVAPDCGRIKAGNEPHPPGSAGRRRSPQTGSRWGAASWGWRHSCPPAEGPQGVCKDKREDLTAFKTLIFSSSEDSNVSKDRSLKVNLGTFLCKMIHKTSKIWLNVKSQLTAFIIWRLRQKFHTNLLFITI